ncbi:MAG: PH domain-containing protein [Planctomycetes bacterium]|nr:PH domain-containing protein [Planctomycetota bacterium]
MEQEQRTTCRQCSAELAAGSAFCNRCGASQEGERPAKAFAPPTAGALPPEETLWKGRYALRAAAHHWLLCALWILVVLTVYLSIVEVRSALGSGLVTLLGVGPALWFLALALLQKLTQRYRLTNQRLFTERGLLRRQHDELELIRIDDVAVRQNLLQRLFDVGTVTVLSTDSSSPRLEIEGIEHPLAVKEQIRAQVRARRARTTYLETL